MKPGSGRGHRCVPHTADVRIEAWAPSREECLAEAVAAMVDSFAEAAGAEPAGVVETRVPPGRDEDLLVSVLDEVIFRMDVDGQLPVATRVRPSDDGGSAVEFTMTGTDAVELVGAVPKAVSLHGLRFDHGSAGWSCAVTLDV